MSPPPARRCTTSAECVIGVLHVLVDCPSLARPSMWLSLADVLFRSSPTLT